MIPARSGSKRLKKKNYLDFDGTSILGVAIKKSQEVGLFDKIIVNSDDISLKKVAHDFGVAFYHRPEELASDDATSDQVVLDFFNEFKPQSLYWINTASPLSKTSDIEATVLQFENTNDHAVVTGNMRRVHAVFAGGPLNFSFNETSFARTQDIEPVFLFNYAVMGWRASAIEDLKAGTIFSSKTLFVDTSNEASFLLKSNADYQLLKALKMSDSSQ